jgi:uncharacterized membrane protein YfcA
MTFTSPEFLFVIIGSLLIGASKTGIPGAGILAVILIANVFTDGRLTNGATTPLLILADMFAVYWYQKHTRWDKVRELIPSVAVGALIGVVFLFLLDENRAGKNLFNLIIGSIVLLMLMIYLARNWLGDRLSPTTPAGRLFAGTAAGFATFVSNAAGPIMSIYMSALKLPKHEFMGTTAWYFFLFNLSKLPFYFLLQWLKPDKPTFSLQTLTFNVMMIPFVIAGVFAGKWLLPRISQKLFEALVLALAAAAAIRLVWAYFA